MDEAPAMVILPKDAQKYKKFRLVPIVEDKEENAQPDTPPNLSHAQIEEYIQRSIPAKLIKKCLALWNLALKDHVLIQHSGLVLFVSPAFEGGQVCVYNL